MGIYLKKFILISLSIVKKILTIIRNKALPDPLVFSPGYYAYKKFINQELDKSYEYFKKYFYSAIFLPEEKLRKYAIDKAIKNDPDLQYLYLEFGVYTGKSTNFFSKKLNTTLFGFDSFEGFNEDWLGHTHAEGDFNLNKKIPKLEKNVSLEIGWVQDMLPIFLKKYDKKKINFIHMDMDTYKTSKFILEKTKPFLVDGAIICFDELYNFEGWSVGEFKALKEVFSEEEYIYRCFSSSGAQVVIEYKKK